MILSATIMSYILFSLLTIFSHQSDIWATLTHEVNFRHYSKHNWFDYNLHFIDSSSLHPFGCSRETVRKKTCWWERGQSCALEHNSKSPPIHRWSTLHNLHINHTSLHTRHSSSRSEYLSDWRTLRVLNENILCWINLSREDFKLY